MSRIDRNYPEPQRSLHGKIYEILESNIINGVYKPGDCLSESKLSEELGVSRTPIREAFRQLEHEGLVVYKPNRGVVVRGFSEEDIQDIYKIRLMLEGMTARRATENITPEQLEELKETIELEEFYTNKNDVKQLARLDSHFHEIIYIASGSRFLIKTLRKFHHYLGKIRSISLSDPERAKKTLIEHKGIFESIQSKDREMAEILMEQHIRNATRYIEKKKDKAE
ncbi:MAG: GntR family transcriptional regulator [Clostridiaceae bacterium]|jgi:DNA-binding GntR family transcriptional regulator|nr:GntR family transcriptional regulator [Clostridiaceae bacterium]